ncbi:MAG TPA: tetratricopeptide repeat-containing sensor histidine kinase [Candidatus Kapabacteria bacterium]|nr:tetratricopeptide repeat-containing sensor histidine kinase [Candidatus Kapabacteria bacterium]
MTYDELKTKVEELEIVIEQEQNYKQAQVLALEIIENANMEDNSEAFATVLFFLAQSLWRNGLPEKGLSYAIQCLDIAEKYHYRDLQARAMGVIGLLYSSLSEFTKSLEYYENSLCIDENQGNKSRIAITHSNIGVVYSNLSNFALAQQYFQKSLFLHEELQDEQGIAGNMLNIGNVYHLLSDSKTAIEYFRRALTLAQKNGNKREETTCLLSIGNVYVKLDEYETALGYYRDSLFIAEEYDNKKSITIIWGNIGTVYVQMSCYQEALEYFYKALNCAKSSTNKYAEALWKGSLGALYLREDFEGYNCKKGEEYLLESIEFFQEHGVKLHEYEMRKIIADMYEREKRWEEFSFHFKRYHELKEQVYSDEVQKLIQNNEYMQIVAEKEKQLAIEKTRIQEREHVMKDLETLNTKLVEADKAKNDILGIVVHDLKNPLTLIQLKADILQTKNVQLTKEQLISTGKSIASVAQHMNRIISNLLDINALESGKMTLKMTSIDVASVVERAVKFHSDSASAKNIIVLTEIQSQLPHAIADAEGLYEVIENLLSNAIKFSPQGLSIMVSCAVEDKTIVLSVKDNGPGISLEDQKKLFGKFQKLSARPTAGEYSTGLGLSIAKTITEQMGGMLECQSVTGQGANFIVRLKRSL